MRLIDADAIKYTEYINGDITVSKEEIERQQTAYDTDKVVEKLEELEVKSVTRYKGGNFGDYDGVDYYIKKSEAIEIVKQGSASDDVCKWKVKSNYYVTECSHDTDVMYGLKQDFKFCPYCGKKIKIVGD